MILALQSQNGTFRIRKSLARIFRQIIMCGLWKLYLKLFFTSSFAFFAVFLSQYTAIWHLLLYFTVNFFARLVLLCFLGFCCYPSPILLFLVSRCHFFSVWVNETPPESSCWFIFHSLAKFLVQKYH